MIEDVEYLLQNSEQDALTFYVDSTLRNRKFYPTPTEYVVNFEQPFKNVTGFDVLDASIPNTMYNIDIYNNGVAFTKVFKYIDPDGYFAEDTAPADLLYEIASSYLFCKIFEDKAQTKLVICEYDKIMNEDVFKNATFLTSKFLVEPGFYLSTRYIIPNIEVSVTKLVLADNMFYFHFDNVKYGIDKLQYPQVEDIIADDNYRFIKNADGTFTLLYFKFAQIQEQQYNSIISSQTGLWKYVVENYYRELMIGNYAISTLKRQLTAEWKDLNITIDATTLIDTTQGKLKFLSKETLCFNAQKSTISINLGFEKIPTNDEPQNYRTFAFRDNDRVFIANNAESENDGGRMILYAPGLVNLLGERYIILRCKEIEDHLLGSYSYVNYTPGLGMFKLATVNDVTNLRFDFISLVRKPFHPIGKLSKLSFRWETSDGRLYDFKGVNHSMLFIVKFLVPARKSMFTQSILNPNYDGNFMNYMSKNRAIDYKEDSDDEEEFDEKKYFEKYRKEMDKYNYEDSESGDGDDSDDEFDFDVELAKRRAT